MTETHADVAELASELGFDAPDERIDDCVRVAEHLEGFLDEFEERPPDVRSRGTVSDDEYNALLEVYPEPRTESVGGLLDGLTFAIKDCIAVEGLRMTCGVRGLSFVPGEDATVVERILDEGGAIVGKANMDAFALGPTGEFSEFGRVVNPVADGHVPGGSSSGSGAAVAGGLVDAALGTDTGGSVRFPASCCGLVGAKPTHRLVSRYGFVDLSPFTDTIGPITRDVETAARVLEAMKGYDVNDPTSSQVRTDSLLEELDDPGSPTIGVPEEFFEAAGETIRERVQSLIDDLDASDEAEIRWVDLDTSDIDKAYSFLVADFAWMVRQNGVSRGLGTGYDEGWRRAFQRYAEEEGFNDHMALRVLPSTYLDEKTDGRSHVATKRITIDFRRRLGELFEEVDLLLTSTRRQLVPEYGAVDPVEYMLETGNNTSQFSLAGTPAVTVPFDEVDGLPIGVQIVAPQFEDGRALRGARLVERLTAG